MAVVCPVEQLRPDVITALRHATRTRHDIVDTTMPMADPKAGPEQFRAHASLLLRWLTPLQARLAGHPQRALQCHAEAIAERCDWLRHDLDASGGLSDVLPAVASLGRASSSDAAYWWGVVYVAEGSQLGAAMLQRRSAANLLPLQSRYLAGDARGPGARWQRFIADLAQHVATTAEITASCTGACWAFDELIALIAAGERR